MRQQNIIILFFFYFILTSFNSAYSQKYPTNNLLKYDSASVVYEINNLYSLILNGRDFGELAFKYTQDPGSFKNSGIIQKMAIENLDEGFRYYIKKLKVGEVSKPFETIFGWHIAKIVEIDSAGMYKIQHILLRYK